jgi:anaerobic selenocysteine-containing dehydrogenase
VAPMRESDAPVLRSICRICNKGCPLVAEVADGRLVSVSGERSNELFGGYTCVKGRAIPAFVNHPDRLLHSLVRTARGFEPIAVEVAMDEIAEKLRSIVAEHGPRSVATYQGTQLQNIPALPLMLSLSKEIGSPMNFGAFTVDKPGRAIAWAMLGKWMAPPHGFHDPRAAMLIGINPFVNGLGGLPNGHPAKWLAESLDAGMELIVIDPRRSDVAKRATIFLQPKPGHDIPILGAMLRVILAEGLFDKGFVEENVRNFDSLKRTVARFDPKEVAAAAGLDGDELVRAARVFASAGRGFVCPGTGPHFAGQGTLLEYMALCLDTVCGHWLREGEVVRTAGVLLAKASAKAQAADPKPSYGLGEPSRVRGPGLTVAGMPSATLAEEILLEGEGRVRALINCGGNPVAAFPDQLQTIEAMQSLNLLVQIDPWMSQTAELAHYIIAPKMTPEMIGTTSKIEGSAKHYATGYGFSDDYAQYCDPVVEPPAGSEVIEDWEFFYGVAKRMGLQLQVTPLSGTPIPLDMEHAPSSEDLVEMLYVGSRVPLETVKGTPGGAFYPCEPPLVVEPKEPGWTGRLDVGNPDMMADLEQMEVLADDEAYPFRMLNRRLAHVVNSSYNSQAVSGKRAYNPAYFHPDDLTSLGVAPGEQIVLRTRRSNIPAIAEVDDGLRPGTISISFGFGGRPATDDLVRSKGSNIARLLRSNDGTDPYSVQPRMSNIPVAVFRVPQTEQPA